MLPRLVSFPSTVASTFVICKISTCHHSLHRDIQVETNKCEPAHTHTHTHTHTHRYADVLAHTFACSCATPQGGVRALTDENTAAVAVSTP